MTSKEHNLYLLVDFDNLDQKIVGTTLVNIVDYLLTRIAERFQPEDTMSCNWVNVRLYGGWYENDILTRKAEALISACPASPLLFNFRQKEHLHSWRVRIELAFSLLSVPEVHLMHTYRRRQKLNGIGVLDPIEAGCDPARCHLQGIVGLIRKNRCPDCGTPANKILWQSEQKLVDVMLATDAITLAMTPDVHICVVSSDDDFWPALFHVSCNCRRIYHMHGVPGRRLKDLYFCHAQPTYVEIPLDEESHHDR